MSRLKLWNWYFIFIFFIRTIWFFSIFMNTTSLNYSDDEVPKGMVFFILLIPYLVPFYFYRPGKYQPTAYMITDFILAVGLFFFFTEAYRSWALYAVTIGYISRGTTHLWTAPALLVIFPVLAINALELCVKDDGEGDDSLTYGFGLTSMKERVASLHGFLEVSSKRFSGTTLICKIPFIKEQSVL